MLSSYIHINYDHLYSNLIGFFYSFVLIVFSQYIWISYKQRNNILYKSLIVSYNKLLCIFPMAVLIPIALNSGVELSNLVSPGGSCCTQHAYAGCWCSDARRSAAGAHQIPMRRQSAARWPSVSRASVWLCFPAGS